MYAGWDLVIWALLLVGVVLWNALQGALRRRRRARERARAQAAAQAPVPTPQPQREREREREAWGRPPATEAEPWGRQPVEEAEAWARRALGQAAQAVVVPVPVAVAQAPPAVRTAARHARWRSRREVRHAVIAMTVLGPPRAIEPWAVDGPEPALPLRVRAGRD